MKQEVKKTNLIVEEHKLFWKKYGCTIMTDGWTDRKRRTILNFLVNSPRGTIFLKSIDAYDIGKTTDKVFKMMDDIVEEVGEEDVIQIVTDNATNYKAAWELLMQKRKKLYWTPCATHCIDLMLEDFEKKIPLHHDTIANGKKITTYIYTTCWRFIYLFLSYLATLPFRKSLIGDGITNCIGRCMLRAIILISCYTIILTLKLIMR